MAKLLASNFMKLRLSKAWHEFASQPWQPMSFKTTWGEGRTWRYSWSWVDGSRDAHGRDGCTRDERGGDSCGGDFRGLGDCGGDGGRVDGGGMSSWGASRREGCRGEDCEGEGCEAEDCEAEDCEGEGCKGEGRTLGSEAVAATDINSDMASIWFVNVTIKS